MDYWQFFPAQDGWGIVPVWGFADAVASRRDGIVEGARVYGYRPMASNAVLRAARVAPRGFVDAAPHRAGLALVYMRTNRQARRTAPLCIIDGMDAPDRNNHLLLEVHRGEIA